MRIANILVFVVALIALIQTLRLFARSRSSIRATAFWALVWVSIGVFGLFPRAIDMVMHSTMMQNRMFFVSLVAILILYAAFFRQDTLSADTRRRVSRLAQEVSLLRLELARARPEGGERDDKDNNAVSDQ